MRRKEGMAWGLGRANLARVRASIGEERRAARVLRATWDGVRHGEPGRLPADSPFRAKKGLRRPKALPLESAGDQSPDPHLGGSTMAKGLPHVLCGSPSGR